MCRTSPPTAGRAVPVGAVEKYAPGTVHLTTVEGVELGIFRLHDGEFRAVLNRCPHRGAPVCRGAVGGTWPPCARGALRFESEGEVLACPWHGWEFDLRTGERLFQLHPSRLRLFATVVHAGVLNVVV